ncbi:hypothetical protein WBP07_06850 [Novosphingobium sp. BL-8A]|uniref:hypothetical protein n=1 Tax=Novosphingobium sp. BL-8A TaxID=3127639 RepID=UPI0037564129
MNALFVVGEAGAPPARISHRPPSAQGWLELLASGLTFDMSGLAPGEAASLPFDQPHFHGFEVVPELELLKGIELVPGGHIAGGGTMPPVLRTLAGLSAALALQLPVSAVAWHSAGTVMAPAYFARMVMNWLSGGVFPALGLAALVQAEDGSIASQGLAAFCGQEFQLEPRRDEHRTDTVKLALRVADHIVRRGPLTVPGPIEGTGLFAEPSQVGKLVWIWRQS